MLCMCIPKMNTAQRDVLCTSITMIVHEVKSILYWKTADKQSTLGPGGS